MPATYDSIATTTLSSAASTITFSSIPNTYTDLRLVFVGGATNATYNEITFNNSTTGYSWTVLSGNGSTAVSDRITSNTKWVPNYPPNPAGSTTIPHMFICDIFSYTGSTNKTGLMQCALDFNGTGRVNRSVGLWQNTSAINSLKLEAQGDTFFAGTTATLYGIKSA